MSNVRIEADNESFIIAETQNGQEGLYNNGTSENAIELEVVISGGWPTTTSPKIQLKAKNKFVTLHGDTVVLDAAGAIENRDFEVVWRGVDAVALKGANGKFVSRETNESNKLRANRSEIGPWETFRLLTI